MIKTVVTIIMILVMTSWVQADFTRKMVCRWTFNGANPEQSLTDDVSGVKLIKTGVGRDQELAFKDGKAVLGGGILLVAPELNSNNEKFAALKEQITVWVKVKFNTSPKGIFLIGLLDSKTSADWGQQTLAAMFTDKNEPRLFGTNPTGKHFGCGLKDPTDEKSGFFTLAISYDKVKNAFAMTANGKSIGGKDKNGEALGGFQCFGIGRMKLHAGAQIEIEEIRIYNAVVTPEWLAEIEPIETNNEPKEIK